MSGSLKMAARQLASEYDKTFKQRLSTGRQNDDRRKWKPSFWKGSNRTMSEKKFCLNLVQTNVYTLPPCSATTIYSVIHKSLRKFRTRLRNNQERQGRKEHINR